MWTIDPARLTVGQRDSRRTAPDEIQMGSFFGKCQGHQEDLRGVLDGKCIAINLCEGSDYDQFRRGIKL